MTFTGIRATNLQLQRIFKFFCQIMNEWTLSLWKLCGSSNWNEQFIIEWMAWKWFNHQWTLCNPLPSCRINVFNLDKWNYIHVDSNVSWHVIKSRKVFKSLEPIAQNYVVKLVVREVYLIRKNVLLTSWLHFNKLNSSHIFSMSYILCKNLISISPFIDFEHILFSICHNVSYLKIGHNDWTTQMEHWALDFVFFYHMLQNQHFKHILRIKPSFNIIFSLTCTCIILPIC